LFNLPDHFKAGMWGFYNQRNYVVADQIYESLVDHAISSSHKQNDLFGQDQVFPAKYIFPLIENIAMSHDSYFCRKWPKNWRPFPLRRVAKCWIGIWYSPGTDCTSGSDHATYDSFFRCPIQCRPPLHPNWISC
jgi:hypothetical protein